MMTMVILLKCYDTNETSSQLPALFVKSCCSLPICSTDPPLSVSVYATCLLHYSYKSIYEGFTQHRSKEVKRIIHYAEVAFHY